MLLALLAASCAVSPVARQAEFVDALIARGRDLLKDAPPSTIRRTGMAISKIAKAFPDSNFAAAANAAMERATSAPTLVELHEYAMSGQLMSVVRANARSLMAVPWRRKLEDDGFDSADLAGELTKLQTGARIAEIDCAKAGPPSELKTAIDEFVNDLEVDGFTADSTKATEFVNDAWACFCGLKLTGQAGDKIQALVDTASVGSDSIPGPEVMYTRVTDAISAIFDADLVCSGNCQKTVTAIIDFITSLGADAFEAGFKDAASSSSIPLELYETELGETATFMPKCICSVKLGDIFAGAKDYATAFVGMIEDLSIVDRPDPEPHQIVAAAKTFLQALLGKTTGFMSSNGLCTKDCRSMMEWMVKFELTMLTSIPFQALADEIGTETALRRRALIGGRALGQVEKVAHDTLAARITHAAFTVAKSGTQAYRLLRGGRRLAPVAYKDTVYNIGTASASCVCDYFDIDRALDILDVFDQNFFKDEEDGGEKDRVKALSVAKELLVFTFSQYGICAGASDGCLQMQTETARLLGLLEAHALEGGLLKSMTLLAKTPTSAVDGEGAVESLLVTIPPCYCSQAVDYGNIFDVYTAWQQDTSIAANRPHQEGDLNSAATSIVAGFMSVSKACLSDECKALMKAAFDFFAGITVATGSENAICTSKNALKCLRNAQSDTCPEAPLQARWIGDVANEFDDEEIKSTRALPTESSAAEDGSGDTGSGDTESVWRAVYWSACNMRHTCPTIGVSAYVIKTALKIANAADVDTPAERANLVKNFVAWINEKAGANVLTESMVTVVVNNNARRGRSLAAATVTFTIETTNEIAKQQVTQVTDSSSTTTTELSTNLGVTVEEAFTTSEVDTVTYPPPPPAPGYKDNESKQGEGDGDNRNMTALIAGIVGGVGGCVLILGVAALFFVWRKKSGAKAAPEKASTPAHQ